MIALQFCDFCILLQDGHEIQFMERVAVIVIPLRLGEDSDLPQVFFIVRPRKSLLQFTCDSSDLRSWSIQQLSNSFSESIMPSSIELQSSSFKVAFLNHCIQLKICQDSKKLTKNHFHRCGCIYHAIISSVFKCARQVAQQAPYNMRCFRNWTENWSAWWYYARVFPLGHCRYIWGYALWQPLWESHCSHQQSLWVEKVKNTKLWWQILCVS